MWAWKSGNWKLRILMYSKYLRKIWLSSSWSFSLEGKMKKVKNIFLWRRKLEKIFLIQFLQKTFSQIKYFFLRKIQVNFEKKVLIDKKKDFSCLPKKFLIILLNLFSNFPNYNRPLKRTVFLFCLVLKSFYSRTKLFSFFAF